MDKVEIRPIELLSENAKGATYTLEGAQTKGFLLAFRKKGSLSGNHWHEGKSAAKNPERLLLIRGSLSLYAKDLETDEVFEQKLEAPLELKIYPKVLHTLTALSDCTFLEFNALEEHVADTFYPEQKD